MKRETKVRRGGCRGAILICARSFSILLTHPLYKSPKMLACAIPAVSKAMGLQPTFAKEANITSIKMEDLCNNGWGRTDYNQRWLHCDLKDMAYFYNYGLSNELVTKGGLKPTK